MQLLKWLLARLRPREVDSNKQYASEILAILVQQSGGPLARRRKLRGSRGLRGSTATARGAQLQLGGNPGLLNWRARTCQTCKRTAPAEVGRAAAQAGLPQAHGPAPTLPACPADANKRKMGASNGIDAVLQAIAPYRNRWGGPRVRGAGGQTPNARCTAVPPCHFLAHDACPASRGPRG